MTDNTMFDILFVCSIIAVHSTGIHITSTLPRFSLFVYWYLCILSTFRKCLQVDRFYSFTLLLLLLLLFFIVVFFLFLFFCFLFFVVVFVCFFSLISCFVRIVIGNLAREPSASSIIAFVVLFMWKSYSCNSILAGRKP